MLLFLNVLLRSINMQQIDREQKNVQASKDIAVEKLAAGGVVWIVLNRPHKHKALARAVLSDLKKAVAVVRAQSDTRFAVLTGAGERFFAAGGDLVELISVRDEPSTLDTVEQLRAAPDVVRACPYLNGDAISGGAELALACDMRIQASHARVHRLHSVALDYRVGVGWWAGFVPIG